MNNIIKLAQSDFKRMFSNVMSVIITIGLIVMPSIFSWYNILACWDVFGNTNELKVAVANSDEGYKGDLAPISINVGEQVISELRENDQIGWVFTDKEDAIDGVKSGKYYAAIVIPPDFSRDMFTFFSDDAEHADVIYYSNDKKNAIAPKVTGQGADAISYQVNEVFAEKMSEIALVLASALSKQLEDGKIDEGISTFIGHIGTVSKRVSETADLVRLYAKVLDSSSDAADDIKDLVNDAKSDMNSANTSLQNAKKTLRKSAKALQNSVDSMKTEFSDGPSSINTMVDSMNTIFDESENNVTAAAKSLEKQSEALEKKSNEYGGYVSSLENLRNALPSEASTPINSAISSLRSISSVLSGAAKDLGSAASKLNSGITDVSKERSQVNKSLSEAKSNLESLSESMNGDIAPIAKDVAEHAKRLSRTTGGALSTLFKGSFVDTISSGEITNSVDKASSNVSKLADELDAVSKQLSDLSSRLNKALADNDADEIKRILTGDVQGFAKALSAPVKLDREVVFPADNFGSAMTPLYATLALFIGSLLIMVAVRPTVCRPELRELDDPKPYQIFIGRFVMIALLSLAQSSLMALGNMLFLEVQVDSPILFFICYWIAGLVFAFIIYSLVATFANLGKAIAVIMLIVQITGCGGSYPLQMFPEFIQVLSPWLPATYAVNAMRSAMFGMYGNDFWIAISTLLLFLVPAAIIGLVLKRPLSKFMNLYLEKVEESGLMG